jgi:hypothetical protein
VGNSLSIMGSSSPNDHGDRGSIIRQMSLRIHERNDQQDSPWDWLSIIIWIGIVVASLTAWIMVIVATRWL